MPRMTTRTGAPTAYAFACGAIERIGVLKIEGRSGCYLVIGWLDNGDSTRERILSGFLRLADARRFARKMVREHTTQSEADQQ